MPAGPANFRAVVSTPEAAPARCGATLASAAPMSEGKLSQGVEWGLHCATLIAQVPDGTALPRRTLAEHYALPEAYLAKHLKALARAGLLTATPGPNGGFRLARPAGQITALEVLEAIDGSAAPFLCQEIRRRGTDAASPQQCAGPCAIATVMVQQCTAAAD